MNPDEMSERLRELEAKANTGSKRHAKVAKRNGRQTPQRKLIGYSITVTADEHRHLQRIALRSGYTKEQVAQTAVRAYLMSAGLVTANGVDAQEPPQ